MQANELTSYIYRPRPAAILRLFTFPFAGGNAAAYRPWSEEMASDIEIVSLELPGRGAALHEAVGAPDFHALIDGLTSAVTRHVGDMPFAFFGHSFGALLAFETARELRRRGIELPLCLFLSAHRCPDQVSRNGDPATYTHNLPEDEFIEVAREWALIPEEILKNEELTALVLRPLRADLRLDETYRFDRRDDPPLGMPCVVYGGRDDHAVAVTELADWRPFFSDDVPFSVEMFDGGHFYLFDQQKALLDSLDAHMRHSLAAAGPSLVLPGAAPFMSGAEGTLGVAELFMRQLERCPNALALEDGERRWSYAELAASCVLLSERMVESGVVRGNVVGVFLPHCAEYVMVLLASLQLGATVCLLENNWPDSQLHEFIEACNVGLVATSAELEPRLTAAGTGCASLVLSHEWAAAAAVSVPRARFEPVPVSPEEIAFISMTSGSTGKPKAVLTTHRGCTYCFLARHTEYPYASEGEREGLNVFFAWECLRPLLFGQVAVVIPDEVIFDPPRLQTFIEDARITRLVVTPSLLENLLDYPGLAARVSHQWRRMHAWFLMGEVVPHRLIEKAAQSFPAHLRLVNAYSTWESLDISYANLLPRTTQAGACAPVGHVLRGSAAILLDSEGRIVPRGAAGELHVAGPGIAPGYLGDEQKTAERFLRLLPELTGAGLVGDALYRTGDQARLLPDGQLMVLGRIDNTIKIRGFKVGLHAVERVLDEMDGVAKSVVVPSVDEQGGQPDGLIAYIVGREGKPSASLLARIRRQARIELPAYAVPAHFIGLAALPMREGESRKLDKRALPAPEHHADTSLEPARLSGIERRIGNVWREVLDVEWVQPADNFFDLGGNSLSAARLIGTLADRYGIALAVVDVYQCSTLQAMAERCRGIERGQDATRRQRPVGASKVAVIGMAGRFPGAGSLDEFWANLRDGHDALRTFSRDELKAKGLSDEVLEHPNWVCAGQVLDDADKFDAAFFGIGQREAALMDPQHRLFMEIAWAAMEQAGYARSDNPYRDRTAVYAACGIDGYLVHHLNGGGLREPLDPGKLFLTEIGNEKDYIATRLAYRLDLGGPAVTVTSACSSGLVAVAQAAQALMSGQCDMALAGASALNFPNFGYCYEEGLVGSIDGKVRPFDEAASGTLFGDSVGAVVLKRLDDALADGDTIWAVLSGYGMSNDGRMKAAYAAPNAAAQTRCIVDALHMAGAASDQISYVEAHATATHIGDAIELKGLHHAFEQTRATAEVLPGSCAIGSVKGNIGHANCAAGITGFIKTVLCLHHRQWVPTAHFHEPNAKLIDFVEHPGSPFHVVRERQEWSVKNAERQLPRRAGVSSFGIGGTNAHVILEEAPGSALLPAEADTEPGAFTREWHVLCMSARTESALATNLENLARALEDVSAGQLAQAAYTLHVAREFHPLRVAVNVTHSAGDVANALRASTGQGKRIDDGHRASVAFCFSGQGSQHVGMARELYAGQADGGRFRGHFEAACAALAAHLGFDPLNSILHADEMQLRRPLITQCGLFALEHALAASLMECGIRPVAVAGHSIGEYAAAVVAGVLDLGDAARLVAARAQACEDLQLTDADGKLVEGGMLSVAGDERTISDWLADRTDLWLAVRNLGGQWVIAGLLPALLEAEDGLSRLGCRCTWVPVSHPFHSALMAPAAERLDRAAADVLARPPQLPMTSNLSGTWLGEEVTRPGYWGQHMLATVRWSENVETLLRWEPDIVLEIGPGTVLTRMLGRFLNARDATDANAPLVLAGMRDPRSAAHDEETWSELMGRLWCAGVPIDWHAYHRREHAAQGVPLRRVLLPAYAFDRNSFWVNPQASIYVDEGARSGIRGAAAATTQLASQPKPGPWLVRYKAPSPDAFRLYCFPFAGGSARHFKDWALNAPSWLDVAAVELPGRNARSEDALPTDDLADRQLLRDLAAAIRADAGDRPFACCGLSYGAALAVELLATELADLERRGQCLATIVVGHAAPTAIAHHGEEIDPQRFLLVPDAVRDNPLWKEWYLPLVLADLASDRRAVARIAARLRGDDGGPLLHGDLVVHCGLDDPACSANEAARWAELTVQPSAGVICYQGGHDFILRDDKLIFQRIGAWIESRLQAQRGVRGSRSYLHTVQWQPLLPALLPDRDAAPDWFDTRAGQEIPLLEDLCKRLNHDDAHVVLLCHGDHEPGGTLEQVQGWMSLLQALLGRGARGRVILILPACAASGPLAGMARVVSRETDSLRLQNVFTQTHPDLSHAGMDFAVVRQLETQALAYPAEQDLLWDGVTLLAPRVLPQSMTALPAGLLGASGGTYLITGGSGALGTLLVDWLIDQQGVPPHRIVLLNRTRLSEHPRAVRGFACDLAKADAVGRVLADMERIDGVFHLAGTLDDCAFHNLDRERLEKVLAPKLGLSILLPHLQRKGCRWVLAFSSTSALLGSIGQSNYAAANAWLDQLAQWPQMSNGVPVVSVAFGSWSEAGMSAANSKALARAKADGETPLSTRNALLALEGVLCRVLGGGAERRFVICDVDWANSPWAASPMVGPLLGDHPMSFAIVSAPAHADAQPAVEPAEPAATDASNQPLRTFLSEYVTHWDEHADLAALGLDSLDIAQVRSGFNKRFGTTVPLSVFADPGLTLGALYQTLTPLVEQAVHG